LAGYDSRVRGVFHPCLPYFRFHFLILESIRPRNNGKLYGRPFVDFGRKKRSNNQEMGESTFIESQKEVQNLTIGDLTFDNFLKKTFVGLLLTIMIAVIMKKKPPVEDKI
tara:strand:+ start:552 stop:881 length:330 start_codon:yes stop_codon:yes gene_type:complete